MNDRLPDPATDRPNIARVYDYLLGGSHHFAADRQFASEYLSRWPEARETMTVNRAFLGRAVRYLSEEAGIRQFVDVGSGIPTMGNVHEIARRTAPGSRVLYVDNDEVAVLHSQVILASDDDASAIRGDLRDPAGILGDPEMRRLIDLTRPVALLLVALLHFLADDDRPADLVNELTTTLAPGSYLVISHGTDDGHLTEVTEAQEFYSGAAAPFRLRSHEEISKFFGGFELIEPGLVRIPLWRPNPGDNITRPERIAGYAGAARKPGS